MPTPFTAYLLAASEAQEKGTHVEIAFRSCGCIERVDASGCAEEIAVGLKAIMRALLESHKITPDALCMAAGTEIEHFERSETHG